MRSSFGAFSELLTRKEEVLSSLLSNTVGHAFERSVAHLFNPVGSGISNTAHQRESI